MHDSDCEAPYLFLETTIQIDRIIGTQERRDTIRHNLNGLRGSTSGHVLGEFNKTLIRDAIAFRTLLDGSPTVEDAMKRLTYYGRGPGRRIALLASLGRDQDKQNTLDRFEKFIEWQAYDHFWEPIDRASYTDEVGCVLKDWTPKQDDNGDYDVSGLKCIKANPPPCAVEKFIQVNRSTIDDFATNSQVSSKKNVRRAGEALGKILNGSETPFGERSNCYPIADTLIVLESREDSAIYSNDRDYEQICKLVGRCKYGENKLP